MQTQRVLGGKAAGQVGEVGMQSFRFFFLYKYSPDFSVFLFQRYRLYPQSL